MSKDFSSDPDAEKAPAVPVPVDVHSESIEKVSAFASLRIPNFRLLLGGSVLANAAMWIQQVTLSWLVYDMTGSGTILGSINLVRAAASVLIIPFAGLLVDRLNRRKLITIENSILFAVTFSVGLTLLLGHENIAYLFIFACIGGTVQTVDMTLRQVLIFDLVPRSRAPNAVALIQTGWSLMRVLGPSIGGFFILWFGAGGNFLIQSGIYVLVAITILQIKFPARKSVDAVQSSPLQNIKDGMQFIAKEHNTRTFMMMGIIMPLLTIPIFSILPPIYAVQVFGDDSGRVLGFLMAAVGVGGIIGGVVAASLGRFEHRGRLQLAALFLLSISLIAFAFSSNLPLALFCLVLAGFFELIFLSTNQTLLQLSIPDHLRGRVTAVVNLSMALTPVGGLLAGVGSDLFGGPKIITIILAGIAAGIAVLVSLFSPTVRNYRLSQGMAANAPKATKESGK
ncbi:MAG: MFS transporter [Dehalococcoidales bacterium]|nr:MFS transporter [Dehalococcoidales bacterium]